jgi:serine/threonine-protein kinase
MSTPEASRTLATSSAAASPEEAEHRAALVRARRFVFIAMAAWGLGWHLDVVAASSFEPGALWRLVGLRVAGFVVILGTWIVLRLAPRMSPRALRLLLLGGFTSVGAIVGLMSVVAGGLTSPNYGGALVVIAGYGVASHVRWQQGVVDLLCIALSYPLVLLGGALLYPSIAAQLGDAHARAILIFDATNLGSMVLIVVIGCHMAWSLRRQVFEARSLGRYKLKERIGEGGMGEVWIAYHHGLKRDVAVKILRTSHLRDAQSATVRFEREVRATTELTHPNTVRVLDYGVTDDGLWYYVMELLAGENLAQLVDREGAQPPARAIHVVAQAARALAEAHAKGIVHRDVKPENLVLTRAGLEPDFVKVVDFGIAKLLDGKNDATLTVEGRFLGTPVWMAPEGFGAAPLGPPADVYALGAVLYLLLSGRPPFEGDNFAALANAHLTLAPPPLPASVPADIAAVVLRCLAKSPGERYASAAELVRALASCAMAGAWQPSETEDPPTRLPIGPVDAMSETEVA